MEGVHAPLEVMHLQIVAGVIIATLGDGVVIAGCVELDTQGLGCAAGPSKISCRFLMASS